MIVTVDWIRKNYNKFNKKYWDGQLPDIEFKISRSKKTWGYASYNYKLASNSVIPVSITISNYYDSPEEVKLNTLLHEMIHIADYTFNPGHFVKNHKKVSGKKYDSHGWWFKLEANRLKFDGWNIEKYVTEQETQLSKISAHSKKLLKNKKEHALVCAIVGNNSTFYCKTQDIYVDKILSTIVGIDWSYNKLGKIKNIYFYRTKNEAMSNRRSCVSKLSGWWSNNSDFNYIISRYDLTKTYKYNDNVKKVI